MGVDCISGLALASLQAPDALPRLEVEQDRLTRPGVRRGGVEAAERGPGVHREQGVAPLRREGRADGLAGVEQAEPHRGVRRVGVARIEVTQVVDAKPQPARQLGPCARRAARRRAERDVRILLREPLDHPAPAHRLFTIGGQMHLMAAARELRDPRLEEPQVGVVPRKKQNLHETR